MAATPDIKLAASPCTFEVNVSKESFKFNAAHFVAYKGFRERLHGHNYHVSVRLLGNHKIGPDGYVVDFGCVKKVAKDVCKQMNEHFLCPMRSDVIDISEEGGDADGGSIKLKCEDGAVFVFPRDDCYMLPIVHATTEELAIFLWGEFLRSLDSGFLLKRGVHTMEVTVSEAVGQEAIFRMAIPSLDTSEAEKEKLHDVATYIAQGEVVPMPCPSAPNTQHEEKKRKLNGDNKGGCGSSCKGCKSELSEKLEAIANAMNDGHFKGKKHVGATDLEEFLSSK